jgi:hypothetical protein
MGKKKFFIARDINTLIPKLERTFRQIEECRKRAEALAAQLPEKSKAVSPAAVAEARMIHSQTVFLMTIVEEDVHYISSLGGVVKDLDDGLVDFPSQLNGEPVWLCWRLGEKEVRFWHSLDEGFSNRQFLQPETSTTLH